MSGATGPVVGAELTGLAGKSRLDLAMRSYTVACARIRALEQEAKSSFAEYHDARERLNDEHQIVSDMKMSAGIEAAYSTYKQELARAEGRSIARTEV